MAAREDSEFSKAITEEMLARGLKEIPKRFPKGFWDDVYERLPEEFKTKWHLNSMAGIWKQRKLRLSHLVTAQLEAAETDDIDQHTAAMIRQTILGTLPETGKGERLRKRFDELLDRKIDERLGYRVVDVGHLGVPHDQPPIPPKEGKRELGSKRHISARADSNLVDLFELEAKSRFHGNASRTLDWVLWNFFGKPRLSFELGGQAQGYFPQEEEPETVGEQ